MPRKAKFGPAVKYIRVTPKTFKEIRRRSMAYGLPMGEVVAEALWKPPAPRKNTMKAR